MPVTSRDITPTPESAPNRRIIAAVVLTIALLILGLRALFPPAESPLSAVPTATIAAAPPEAAPPPAAPTAAPAAPTAAPDCPAPVGIPDGARPIYLAVDSACPHLVQAVVGADTVWMARPPDLGMDLLPDIRSAIEPIDCAAPRDDNERAVCVVHAASAAVPVALPAFAPAAPPDPPTATPTPVLDCYREPARPGEPAGPYRCERVP